MSSQNKCKKTVDAYKLRHGQFLCEVLIGEEWQADETVDDVELLAILCAKNGLIPDPITSNDVNGDPVTQVFWLTLPEWIEAVGSERVAFHLSECINARDSRTERPIVTPVPYDRAARLHHLNSIINSQSQRA